MLDDWLPYHPKSRVALTYVSISLSDDPYLIHAEMTGTARTDQRRAFARGEGVWWIRGHYDASSIEGQALLAAHALSQGRAA